MIIGEYSPRQSRGEYSPIITEPEANNCFSIFTQAFCVFWDLITLISLSVTSTKWLAAILKISILLYSPVGEYSSFYVLKYVKFDHSICRICYIHLCKNTNRVYSTWSLRKVVRGVRVKMTRVTHNV